MCFTYLMSYCGWFQFFLNKWDRASMSNSVEVRMPFLDNNVRLFGLALSGSNKLKNGFTKSIALELASRNIRCNAIAPGFIETDMTSKDGSGLLDKWIESIPLKRAGIVDDVSELCLFLASDKASYITGQIINVDGGLVT